jgi:archaellum component FlaC
MSKLFNKEDLLRDIDFELALLEDYLHGQEGKKITAIRVKLQAASKENERLKDDKELLRQDRNKFMQLHADEVAAVETLNARIEKPEHENKKMNEALRWHES